MNLVSLIDEDIKRLKSHRLVSLKLDLEDLFKVHERTYTQFGTFPGQIASGKDFRIHKVHLAVSNPYRPPNKGVRVWIYFNTVTEEYIQVLLYLASEKNQPRFRSNACFKEIQDRLDKYSRGLS